MCRAVVVIVVHPSAWQGITVTSSHPLESPAHPASPKNIPGYFCSVFAGFKRHVGGLWPHNKRVVLGKGGGWACL